MDVILFFLVETGFAHVAICYLSKHCKNTFRNWLEKFLLSMKFSKALMTLFSYWSVFIILGMHPIDVRTCETLCFRVSFSWWVALLFPFCKAICGFLQLLYQEWANGQFLLNSFNCASHTLHLARQFNLFFCEHKIKLWTLNYAHCET